jgi:hypothetical protein
MNMYQKWILTTLLVISLTSCAQATLTATPTAEQPAATGLVTTATASPYPPPQKSPIAYPQPQTVETEYPSPSEPTRQSPYPGPQVEFMQAEMRFGIPEVDRVLEALYVSPDNLDTLIVYTKAQCTKTSGLGGPPKCAAGQNEGTTVEVLPILGPEGHFILKGSHSLAELLGQTHLLGVFKVVEDFKSEDYYPSGLYGIVLTQQDNAAIIVLRLNQDGIVRVDFPDQIPGKEQPDLEVYLEPIR